MFQTLRITSRSWAVALIASVIACMPLCATAADAASRGDIVAVTVHGTATATMAGMTVPLSAGAILQLPATVRTGADGAVELRQGNSTFAAAGNTELEIPQSAAQDGLVERIVQIRGNAFYNIGKRTGTRLRVEAPYLVAVIKGTQFNVAAQEDSTTIALFEGHLEVRASDDSDVVDLNAGEIAIRRRDDVSINVLRLTAARGNAVRNEQLAAQPLAQQSSPPVTAATDTVTARIDGATAPQPRIDASTPTDVRVDALADSSAIETPGVTAKATVELGTTEVTPSIDARVTADVAAGAVDVGAGATVAAGDVAAVDVGAAAAVDVPSGAVAVDAGATVAAGAIPVVDAGVGAAVDVPAGTVDVGVDTTIASAPIDASVGVDVGTGTVGADVGVGAVDVGVSVGSGGLDVNLGLGADDSESGLLGGLLGRRPKH